MATPWLAAAIEENIGHGNTGRGRWNADRARWPRPGGGAHPRHHRPRSRPCDRGERAEGRGASLSGTALLMGQLRAESLNLVDAELCGAHHAGRHCDRLRRRHRQAARPPALPPSRRPACRRHSRVAASAAAAVAARTPRTAPQAAALDTTPERIARGPRLARQPEPDRARRPEPQRDRPEERQSPSSTTSSAATNGRFENISLSLRRPSGGGVALERR